MWAELERPLPVSRLDHAMGHLTNVKAEAARRVHGSDGDGGEEDDGGARHVEAVIAYSIPGVGGHHYVRGNVGMMEGMWAWTVSIEEDTRGDMHTLLGVCFEDVKQAKYDQARQMLLVAGWSGRAYKQGNRL